MTEFIPMREFAQALFDQPKQAEQAAAIMQAVLAARSPRLSDIADKMTGGLDRNYKRLQRFLKQVKLLDVLWRLFQAEAPFVSGDTTEIPWPQAKRT